jgi:hypothetical protein
MVNSHTGVLLNPSQVACWDMSLLYSMRLTTAKDTPPLTHRDQLTGSAIIACAM